MDPTVKFLIEIAVLVGGFVSLVLVMRAKLERVAEDIKSISARIDSLEKEVRPLAAQITSLVKDSEASRRDVERLTASVERMKQTLDDHNVDIARIKERIVRAERAERAGTWPPDLSGGEA